jgi:2,3-bisphosphoglycerate-independent phosphoglycerate mutase
MDRDNRWERVAKAYNALTNPGHGSAADAAPVFKTALEAVEHYYDNPTNDSQKGDEFITPRVIEMPGNADGLNWKDTRVGDGDVVLFYNYRGDRPREIIRAFVMPEFYGNVPPSPDTDEKGFNRGRKIELAAFVTMTAYEVELGKWVSVAFPKPPKMKNIAGQFVCERGMTQFRSAETEKFPHVTFFFNDYRDDPFEGESRAMAQSPKVATYDKQPEMSAAEVCQKVCDRLDADDCEDFILVNFANGDMVGHTGVLEAAIKAVETVDECVGKIVDKTLARGGCLIVTADHGNAEQMFDPVTNAPHTAHTTYDVECILVADELKKLATGGMELPSPALREGGRLADVVPTLLAMMKQDKPSEMTGVSLVKAKA